MGNTAVSNICLRRNAKPPFKRDGGRERLLPNLQWSLDSPTAGQADFFKHAGRKCLLLDGRIYSSQA